MIFSADLKNRVVEYVGRSREYRRALARRFRPAFSVRSRKENVFISRVAAMTLLAGVVGGIFGLLPQWPSRPWFEGVWLGVALSLTAAHRGNSLALGWRILLGAVFGIGFAAFARISFPYVGLAVLGIGIGALMADDAPDSNVKMDTMLATIVAATLGGWAVIRLGPTLSMNMPPAMSMAAMWGILGMFFSLGALPAHIVVSPNTVLKHVRRIRRKLEKEHCSHLDRLLERYLDLIARDHRENAEEMESFLIRKSKIEEALLETADSSLALQTADRLMRSIPEESLMSHERELRARYENVKEPGMKNEIERTLAEIQESLARRERLELESERLKLMLFRMNLDIEFVSPS